MKLANKGRQKILTSLMFNENIDLNGVKDFVNFIKRKKSKYIIFHIYVIFYILLDKKIINMGLFDYKSASVAQG